MSRRLSIIKATSIHGGKGVKIYGVDFTEISDALEYIHFLIIKRVFSLKKN